LSSFGVVETVSTFASLVEPVVVGVSVTSFTSFFSSTFVSFGVDVTTSSFVDFVTVAFFSTASLLSACLDVGKTFASVCAGICGAVISAACALIPVKKKNPDNEVTPKS